MKILLADDHFMVREGMKLMLNKLADEIIIEEAENYFEVIDLIRQATDFNLMLVDKTMPGMSMDNGLSEIIKQAGNVPVIMLSASENPVHMKQALELGAKGYIPKSSDRAIMLNAMQLVLSGGTYLPPEMLLDLPKSDKIESVKHSHKTTSLTDELHLTPRQIEVLDLISKGKSNKGIARVLGITDTTVATHVNTIFKLLKVNNRIEAVNKVRNEVSDL